MRQLIVSHPDTQHSVHAARGLRRAGLLRFLFTSLSLRRPPWLGPVVRSAAPGAYARLAQHRAHEDFDPRELRTYPIHALFRRLGEREWARSQARFARKAGELALREGCGVLAFNSAALQTFQLLKPAGLPCVLDQSIAHRRWSVRVGQAECDAHPEWGDRWTAPEWKVVPEDEEIALADLILCGSEFCAGTMREEGVDPAKLAVVPYGADTGRFTPRRDPRPEGAGVRLLFVGMLAVRKGFHYVAEAARRLRPLGITVTAVGASRVRADHLARFDNVHVEGFRLHADMPELYRRHDVYVFPSLVEGSSLSIYEALASGLPVVTTPNAGSIVRDGVEGIIVPARDLDALCAAIERLVREPELRETMGRAARLRAEACGDWRHYGERLSGLLARHLSDGAARAGGAA